MEWKSFAALKHGQRQLPRLEDLETLAQVLEVDPAHVFQVGRGIPAEQVAADLQLDPHFRTVIDRVTDAVFTVDEKGRIRDSNNHFRELLGRSAAELHEASLVNFIDTDSASRLLSVLGATARKGEVRGADLVLQSSDRRRIVQLDAVRIEGPQGESLGAQISARDVTEERNLVRELDAQRRDLQTVHDAMPAACLLLEPSGAILRANARVQELCSAASEELVGRHAAQLFGDPEGDGFPLHRTLQDGEVQQKVSSLRTPDGSKTYVLRMASPILREGRIERIVELWVDVTTQVEQGDLRVLALWRGSDGASPGEESERRRSPRARTSFTARYLHGDREQTGTVTNLGEGGMFLQTGGQAPGEGEEIEVEWLLPGDDVPVRARGVVVWTRSSDSQHGGGLGIQFTQVTPQAAAHRTKERSTPPTGLSR